MHACMNGAVCTYRKTGRQGRKEPSPHTPRTEQEESMGSFSPVVTVRRAQGLYYQKEEDEEDDEVVRRQKDEATAGQEEKKARHRKAPIEMQKNHTKKKKGNEKKTRRKQGRKDTTGPSADNGRR